MSKGGSIGSKVRKTRQFTLSAKVTEEDKARVTERAKAAGMTVSEFVLSNMSGTPLRSPILMAAARDLLSLCHTIKSDSAGISPALVEKLIQQTRQLISEARLEHQR